MRAKEVAGWGFAFHLAQPEPSGKTGREQSRCAQPSSGMGRILCSCFPGSGREPALSHRWDTRAQPQHTHPGLCSHGLAPAASQDRCSPLSGDAGSSQSSVPIAGPWCTGSPAACTQQGSGTIYFLYTFPLAKRDFLWLFGLRCFSRLSLFS